MAEIEPIFETLENRLMRAWVHGDLQSLKTLIHGDFIFMFGTEPLVLLDRPSLIAGAENGLRCKGYRFNEVTARKHGRTVWFTGHVELELKIANREWSGHFLLTDLWRKGVVRRKWKLVERGLAPLDKDNNLSDAIRSLQLWR